MSKSNISRVFAIPDYTVYFKPLSNRQIEGFYEPEKDIAKHVAELCVICGFAK